MNWNRLGCYALLLLAPLPAFARGAHVNLIDYPSDETAWERAFALEDAVAGEFAALCADTFCEGDYSNYRVMEFRCAVLAHRGTVQRCVLVVAASELEVQPDTGQVQVDNGSWVCPIELQPGCQSRRSMPHWKRRAAWSRLCPGVTTASSMGCLNACARRGGWADGQLP